MPRGGRRVAGIEDGAYSRLTTAMEHLVSVFIEFLRSPDSVETFSQGGAVHGLVVEIAEAQHELGRDAVGVIEDFAVLRRCIWRTVEKGVDLPALGGGEVAAFFLKLIKASDWVTEAVWRPSTPSCAARWSGRWAGHRPRTW